jgi:FimV-like protein
MSATSVELARSYIDQGDFERAKGLLTEVAAKDAQYPDTYFFFAKMLKGKPQKEALQHYLQMAPGGTYAPDAERILKTGK